MTNGEMGISMDLGLDKRAAIATLWTNITKQGCSMTLRGKTSRLLCKISLKGCKLVDIGKIRGYRHLANFEVAIEEMPYQSYE